MIEGIHPAPEKPPLLGNIWSLGKLGILLVLVGFGMIAFSLVGVVFTAAVYHLNIFANPEIFSDLSQPGVVSALKWIQTLSVIGGFVVPAFVFGWLVGKRPLQYLRLNVFPSPLLVLLVIVAVVCASPAINMMAEFNSKMTLPGSMKWLEDWMKSSEEQAGRMTEEFLKMSNVLDLIIDLFIIAFLAAVGEELLFRGSLQNVLRSWMKNKHAAIWTTAILFSAFHLQFYGFIPRMMLGALLGYLYEWSGSLWLPILAHFINNGVAVFASYLLQKQIISMDPTQVGTGSGGIVPALVSAVIVAALLFLVYKKRPVQQS